MKKNRSNKVVVTAGIGDYKPEEAILIFKCRDAVVEGLRSSGYDAICFDIHDKDFLEKPEWVISSLKEIGPDCVFNLFEGVSGDSMTEVEFARMLEAEEILFTGNNSEALETCLDKDRTKKILEANGIKVPSGIMARTLDDVEGKDIKFPVFVKPACEDASLGIDSRSLASNMEELRKAVGEKLRKFPKGIIVEEFISGREYNAGFLGYYPYELMGISMLDYEESPGCVNYLNFNAKWKTRAAEYKKLMPVVLDEKDERYSHEVAEISCKAARALGCSRYFRVDFREKDGELYVLDVNPNPDISPDSGLIRQAYLRNLSYADVIARITENAMRRDPAKHVI
ncbi:MAG: D-alanine--D-alanine ligase [Candidatus Omnitrophota bacterium]